MLYLTLAGFRKLCFLFAWSNTFEKLSHTMLRQWFFKVTILNREITLLTYIFDSHVLVFRSVELFQVAFCLWRSNRTRTKIWPSRYWARWPNSAICKFWLSIKPSTPLNINSDIHIGALQDETYSNLLSWKDERQKSKTERDSLKQNWC